MQKLSSLIVISPVLEVLQKCKNISAGRRVRKYAVHPIFDDLYQIYFWFFLKSGEKEILDKFQIYLNMPLPHC